MPSPELCLGMCVCVSVTVCAYVQVYRYGKWEQLPGEAVFPGDVISIGRPAGGTRCHKHMSLTASCPAWPAHGLPNALCVDPMYRSHRLKAPGPGTVVM